jgi:formylglycine-generating enzyme required for sulfatase activity
MIEDKLRQAEPSYRRSKTRTPQESLRLTQLEERARYLKATWVAESERLVSDLLAMAHREDFPAAQHLIAKVSAALFSDGGSRLHPARRKTLMERIQNNDVPYHQYIRPVMARALTEGVPAQVDVHPIHEPLRPIHGLRWTFTRLQQEKDSYGDETGNFVKGPSISIDPQGARPLLGQGYYIFELAAPGYAPMNVPISLSYEKIKSHLESGRSLSFGLEMVPADWVPKDMKVIHHTTGYIGHDFYHDGDTVSAHSFPRRTIEIPTQALTEGPISVGQYIPFIEDLLGQNNALYRHGGREFLARLTEIEALLPRTTIPVGARRTSRRAGKGEDGIQYYWKLEQKRLLGIGPVTQVRLIDPTTHLDPFDDPIHLGQPISAIPLDSGFAFAAWRSKKEGVPYEVADADTLNVVANSSFDTRYPWGNGQITDTYVVSRGTFEDVSRATPQLIGSHPLGPEFYRDSSWYGIRDLIGNIRKSTSTEGEPDHLVLFAGSLRMYPGANFSPASRYQAHRKWAMDSDGAFFLSLKFPKKK